MLLLVILILQLVAVPAFPRERFLSNEKPCAEKIDDAFPSKSDGEHIRNFSEMEKMEATVEKRLLTKENKSVLNNNKNNYQHEKNNKIFNTKNLDDIKPLEFGMKKSPRPLCRNNRKSLKRISCDSKMEKMEATLEKRLLTEKSKSELKKNYQHERNNKICNTKTLDHMQPLEFDMKKSPRPLCKNYRKSLKIISCASEIGNTKATSGKRLSIKENKSELKNNYQHENNNKICNTKNLDHMQPLEFGMKKNLGPLCKNNRKQRTFEQHRPTSPLPDIIRLKDLEHFDEKTLTFNTQSTINQIMPTGKPSGIKKVWIYFF